MAATADAAKQEFATCLLDLLKNNDLSGAREYLRSVSEGTGEKPKIDETIFLPHPYYGKVSPLEIAIINNDEGLLRACAEYQRGTNAYILNAKGFSLEYLYMLNDYKGFTIQWNATVTYKGRHNYCAAISYDDLTMSISHGHVNVFNKILGRKNTSLDEPIGAQNRLPIQIAALYNRVEIFQTLAKFSSVSTAKWYHQCDMGTTLHIAARLGHVNIVKVLIDEVETNENAEKLEERDSVNHTAMSLAVLHLHGPVVQMLAEKGAKMDGLFGMKKQTLFDIIFSGDCQARQEFLVKDKSMRDQIIICLCDHCPEQVIFLSKERLAHVEEIKQRQQLRPHYEYDTEEQEEDDSYLPLTSVAEDDDETDKKTPTKKKLVECKLCDKKFTSEISLQAHLKSKGHIKQERKDRLQKKNELNSPEKVIKQQKEVIGLIERLPLLSELINLILIKLEVSDLRRFGATSKSIKMLVDKQNVIWKEISYRLTSARWNRFKERQLDDIKHCMREVEKFICVEPPDYYGWEKPPGYDNIPFEFPKLCENLKELRMKDLLDNGVPVSLLGALFQKCTKLRKLKIKTISPWKSSKREAVEKGELNVPEEEPAAAPVNAAKPWKKKKVKKTKRPDPNTWLVNVDSILQSDSLLEHFSIALSFPEHVACDKYLKIMADVLKRCPNLVHLSIYNPVNDNVVSTDLLAFLLSVLDTCQKLKVLKLKGEWLFGRLPVADYNNLFKKFSHLEGLSIEGSEISSFDQDIHECIAQHCTNLKKLKINHQGEVLINGPHFPLAALTNLTHFGFSKENPTDQPHWDRFLMTMAHSCKNIQNLDLWVSPLSETIMNGVAQFGPSLKSFKQRCWVDNAVYAQLVKCTNLTELFLLKVRLEEFYCIIDHCKLLEKIDVTIEPHENNNNNAAQNNNANVVVQNNNNNNAVANPAENNDNNEPNNNGADNNQNNDAPVVPVNENNVQQNNENNNDGAQAQNNNNDINGNGNNNNNDAGNNNNIVPVEIEQESEEDAKMIDFGRIFAACRHLVDLKVNSYEHTGERCFRNFFVSTSLKKLSIRCGTSIYSDFPLFYLAECCPNLVELEDYYPICPSNWAAEVLETRFPKLERLFLMPADNYLEEVLISANKARSTKFIFKRL